MLNRNQLHQYQNEDVEFVKATPACGLFLDLGLGKSVTTLTAISDLIESKQAKRVLIFAPLRVANATWSAEVNKWSHLKHLKVNVCTGTPKNRVNNLSSEADIYVINIENAKWLAHNSGVKWKWDMIVWDESHKWKNPSSQRFKALKRVLVKGKDFIQRKVILTGTPSPNNLLDLWAQVYLLDFGKRLGHSFTAYKNRYFDSDYMGYSWTAKPESKDTIYRAISDITRTRSAEDHLDLPECIDLHEYVVLPAKVMKMYKELEKEFFIELNDEENIEAMTAATLGNKLLQLSNSGSYDADGKYHHLHDEKIKALQDLAEDGENMIVAYNYKFDLELLKQAFPDAVVLDKKGLAIEAWNRGEIKMLLASPASAAEGLNLQAGGSVIVWYGLTWSLGHYLQFNGRVYRQGQKKRVRIIHLVAKGCMDEKVLRALESKATTQQELLDYLKLYNEEF